MLHNINNSGGPAKHPAHVQRRNRQIPFVVATVVVLGWATLFFASASGTQAVITTYQAHALEIVRMIARSVSFASVQNTELRPSEMLRQYFAPISIAEHKGLWVFSDTRLMYYRQTFDNLPLFTPAQQAFTTYPGATGYEGIIEAISNGQEGTGFYTYNPADGPMVVAWTSVTIGNQRWVIGMPARLSSLTADSGADAANIRLILIGGFLTLLVSYLTWSQMRASSRQASAEATLEESNRLLGVLIDSSPFAVIATDSKGNIRLWNHAAEELFNYPRNEALGQPANLITRWVKLENISIDSSLTGREVSYTRRSGQPGTLRLALPRMRDSKRAVYGMVFFLEDVTSQKKMADSLRVSESNERQQREWLEAMRDSIHIITSDLNLEHVMRRVMETIGRVVPHDAACILLAKGDIMELSYWRNLPTHVIYNFGLHPLPINLPKFQKMERTGQPYVVPNVHEDPDWVEVDESDPFLAHVSAPMLIGGRLIGTLNVDSMQPGIYTAEHGERLRVFADQVAIAIENARLYAELRNYADSLEQRVAERTEALTAANERLQHADMLKTKFISDISHELRTPVTSLNTRLFLIERDSAERRPEHLQSFKDQLKRLNRLLEDVLNFSRFEAQLLDPRAARPLSINRIVEDVVKMHQPAAEVKGLQMTFTPDPNLPDLRGHSTDLFRAFSNLITNAINYTARGEITIRTHYALARNEISVEVADTGMGISPEDMPHLFERFYRGKRVGSSTLPGTGLGLSLVKEIIEKHAGKIEVESVVEQGSTFRINLPLNSPPIHHNAANANH